jgi:hypothetical protein
MAAAPEFAQYQRQVVANARALCARMQQLGYHVVSGGTDNHLILVDLNKLGIDGARVQVQPHAQLGLLQQEGKHDGTHVCGWQGMHDFELIIARACDVTPESSYMSIAAWAGRCDVWAYDSAFGGCAALLLPCEAALDSASFLPYGSSIFQECPAVGRLSLLSVTLS